MTTEKLENRLVKGLWSLTGLKSSDYIRLIRESYPDLTGSRLRGIMSVMSNDNYRSATLGDVVQCFCALALWAGCPELSEKMHDLKPGSLANALALVDEANQDSENKGPEKARKVIEKCF